MSLSEIVRPSDEVQRSIADGLVALHTLRRQHPYEATTSQRDVDATSALVARQWVEARRWHSEKTSEKAVDRIVEALLPPSPGDPLAGKSGGVVALARSHREVQHVTRRLRRRMRDAGLLTGPDFRLIAVTPMGVANRLDIAIGDRIRFLARSKRLDVYNGTCAAIVAIDGNPKAPRISVEIDELNGGKRSARFLVSEFFDKEARVRFAPAYVSTIYGAQGITEENIIILKAAAMSFREFYVGATRARASCEIVEAHPKRAFLNANENTRDQMICDIAAELTRAVRQDRPKAVAEDHRAPSNRPEPAKKDWTFAKMLQPAEP
jgi:ATP-dependent exoDNAse (exonuclease V) alpha subunit